MSMATDTTAIAATLRKAIAPEWTDLWTEDEVRRRAERAGVSLSPGTVRFFADLGGGWSRVHWCSSWDPMDLDTYLNPETWSPTWQEYVEANVSVLHGDGAVLIPDPAPWLRLIEWAHPKVVLLDERQDDPMIVTYDPEIQGWPTMPYGLRWTGVTLWHWMAMLSEAVTAGDIYFDTARTIPGMTQREVTSLTSRIECFLEGPWHALVRGGWEPTDLLLGLTDAGWYDPRWGAGATPELVLAVWAADVVSAEVLLASARRGLEEGNLVAVGAILAGIRMIRQRDIAVDRLDEHEADIADLTTRTADLLSSSAPGE